MFLAIEYPTAFVLGLAALLSSLGGIVSTILAAYRARNEERSACEDKLRAMYVEAAALAEQLYRLRVNRTEPE